VAPKNGGAFSAHHPGGVGHQRRSARGQGGGVQALGVVLGLREERGDGREHHHPFDAPVAMARQIAGDFAAAGGMTDERHVAQVELLDQRGQIVGEGVVVIASPRPVGPAMPAPVERDAAQARRDERGQLVVPHV
jgi:hypothetical protein